MDVKTFNISWNKTTLLETNLVLIGVFSFHAFKSTSLQANSHPYMPLLDFFDNVIFFNRAY